MTGFRGGILLAALMVALAPPVRGEAQKLSWLADATLGYTGFVDEATEHVLAMGGAVRKQVTPRISIGPEVVVTRAGAGVRDLTMMLTGNVVFDAYPIRDRDARRVTPFLVGGLGLFWSRDRLVTGPFWSSDPAFTAGGGVRGRLSDRVSLAGEYRIGWELHQRVTGTVTFELR